MVSNRANGTESYAKIFSQNQVEELTEKVSTLEEKAKAQEEKVKEEESSKSNEAKKSSELSEKVKHHIYYGWFSSQRQLFVKGCKSDCNKHSIFVPVVDIGIRRFLAAGKYCFER